MVTTHKLARRGSFPDRLALINDLTENKNAFEMRYAKEIQISNGALEKVERNHVLDHGESVVSDGKGGTLLKYTTKSEVYEAVLLVAPYVRIIEGDGLRGRLVLRLDGEVIVDDPLERHLVTSMESPVLDVPMRRPSGVCAFYAAAMTDKGSADPNVAIYGIMAPNGSGVEIAIQDPIVPKGGTVRVDIGCIAALYTTKR